MNVIELEILKGDGRLDKTKFQKLPRFFPEYLNKKLHAVFYCFNPGQ
jgi:hypothetical protein